jgi:hypothetical protein
MSLVYSPTVEVVCDTDTIEVKPHAPPTTPEHVIDSGLAGAFSDLLAKVVRKDGTAVPLSHKVEVAAIAIKQIGYARALQSDTAVHDLDLLGPSLTQEVVEASFSRVATMLQAAEEDWVGLASRIDSMGTGDRVTFCRRPTH